MFLVLMPLRHSTKQQFLFLKLNLDFFLISNFNFLPVCLFLKLYFPWQLSHPTFHLALLCFHRTLAGCPTCISLTYKERRVCLCINVKPSFPNSIWEPDRKLNCQILACILLMENGKIPVTPQKDYLSLHIPLKQSISFTY